MSARPTWERAEGRKLITSLLFIQPPATPLFGPALQIQLLKWADLKSSSENTPSDILIASHSLPVQQALHGRQMKIHWAGRKRASEPPTTWLAGGLASSAGAGISARSYQAALARLAKLPATRRPPWGQVALMIAELAR